MVEISAGYGSTVVPIRWLEKGCLALLDQRVLPGEERYIECVETRQVADAIVEMVVRGAPAIGIAAAYGVVLSAKRHCQLASGWRAGIEADIDLLAATRPTAVNLFWALQQCRGLLSELSRDDAFVRLTELARQIHQDDIAANMRMGRLGAEFVSAQLAAKGVTYPINVLTHCNTGSLATGGFGTALGVVRSLAAQNRLGRVYADETRPWLQGARLTVWELTRDAIHVTLNVDSAAAQLMKSGRVDCVIVGADRITANGDVANKIGTYGLAVLAKQHGIGFYVAAPWSTIDPDTANGDLIPIEERVASEVLSLQGKWLSLPTVDTFNPVFDVTPAELVNAIITEQGVITAPFDQGIKAKLD
ncbi:MAG: S-methyl-5-thioribose-1-phosphate isomerase [Gammaproteobacteria bacterium]|nr:MAG: S-methyl-5-thioribose-1-phosphate isomerase [Gammaproteobacteria bacterium]